MAWLYVILAIIVIALVIVIANLKIVPQSKAYVIERLGAYLTTWQTGFHVKIPFFERIAKVVSLKEQVVDFAPQPVITKDNVTMQIDTVVFFQITDPKLYTYGVEHPISAIENLSATTLPAHNRRMTALRHRISFMNRGYTCSYDQEDCCINRGGHFHVRRHP
jgi:regulator of protease activity HflC (stomatin/prohibitin superfamily)